MTTPHLG